MGYSVVQVDDGSAIVVNDLTGLTVMTLSAAGVVSFTGSTSATIDVNTAITAFAGGGQGSATALTGDYNEITVCATAGDSVKLKAAVNGVFQIVKNTGAASLAVFPNTGDSLNDLAVNLSVNIPVGGELTFTATTGTIWETLETVVLSAPTTQSGEFGMKGTDNAGDFEVILTNASHSQSTVTSLPDPGGATGTIVLEEIANVFDVPQVYDANNTITALAGGAQGGAGALTGEFNNVTVIASEFDSVTLPASVAGKVIAIKHSAAANILSIFPPASSAINGLAVNLSVDCPVGGLMVFYCITATLWEYQEAVYVSAPSTQSGGFGLTAADNAANHDVLLKNASHGQSTVVTFGDSGIATSFVPQSTAHITVAEMDVLDTAVQGTVVASKAMVADAQKANDVLRATGSTSLGGTAVPGAATVVTEITKAVTAFTDTTAKDVFTVTIPNAAHAAMIGIDLLGVTGAGGAIGAGESTAVAKYTMAVARTAGVATVVVLATIFGDQEAAVAGADILTSVIATVSAMTGAVGAEQTFTIKVAITKSAGASDNHTLVATARILNGNATGITLA